MVKILNTNLFLNMTHFPFHYAMNYEQYKKCFILTTTLSLKLV